MKIFGFSLKHKHGSVSGEKQPTPQPLAIEGIPEAPITPEPDNAELAAQALLELMSAKASKKKHRNHDISESRHNDKSAPSSSPPHAATVPGDSVAGEKGLAYYHALASRIREAHAKSVRQVTRFVAACEYTLKDKHLPYYGAGSLALLEAELYKRIDIIEREGGELKRRWQHCLAEVTVRLMDAPPPPEKNGGRVPGDSVAGNNPSK